MTFLHKPVMLKEVLKTVTCNHPVLYLDLTAGGGGHAQAFLEKYSSIKGILLDRDNDAVTHLKKKFSDNNRVKVVKSEFSFLDKILFLLKSEKPDIVFADLGLSSYQLDRAERGFSIMNNGPFDMRMNRDQQTTAFDYIKNTPVAEIKRVLSQFAQEREAIKVSKVLKQCVEEGLNTTSVIAERVRSVKRYSKKGIDPATLVFMAIRMAVNDELGEIESMLKKAFVALSDRGVMAIITFHSTEDRVVKNFFRDRKQGIPFYSDADKKVPFSFKKVEVDKVLVPSKEEIEVNPRARSAKLRILRKIF